jgi:PHD/YefM family antitoxin component YafN of YafNO toxin-antitoxin module
LRACTSYCDEVAASGEPLIIKRRSGADVALVSVDELVGLEETELQQKLGLDG